MSEIIFTQIGNSRHLELQIDGDSTWMAVAEEFVTFLQGCGYQVTGADVADYLTEVYSDVDLGSEQIFDFTTASEQYEQDTMATGGVTLDDVMHTWGTTQVTDPVNTITITTR